MVFNFIVSYDLEKGHGHMLKGENGANQYDPTDKTLYVNGLEVVGPKFAIMAESALFHVQNSIQPHSEKVL